MFLLGGFSERFIELRIIISLSTSFLGMTLFLCWTFRPWVFLIETSHLDQQAKLRTWKGRVNDSITNNQCSEDLNGFAPRSLYCLNDRSSIKRTSRDGNHLYLFLGNIYQLDYIMGDVLSFSIAMFDYQRVDVARSFTLSCPSESWLVNVFTP